MSGRALVCFCSPRWSGWRTEKYNSFSLLSVYYTMLWHRWPRPRLAAPLAKMNGFQRGLDSHPLYALDARSRHSLPNSPSHPCTRSKRGTSLSLGHYSIMLGTWRLGGGKIPLRREMTVGFFARELRCFGVAVARTAIISPSLSVCTSVCLSLAISARSFVQPQPSPSQPPSSALLSSPLLSSLHPYVSGTGHNGLRDGPVGRRRHRPRPEDGG